MTGTSTLYWAIVATACAVILAAPAHAKNAAGSIGARNQGASHHVGTIARHGRVLLLLNGPTYIYRSDGPLTPQGFAPWQGLAPELQAAMSGNSSEARYRAELCGTLPTHAEQRACFNRK
jgi:hypothetical protein